MVARFKDRREAGQALARRLKRYLEKQDLERPAIVLGLPRGGIIVGYEIAMALQAPLDVCLVRKLGLPRQPELAMGAIASHGYEWLDTQMIRMQRVSTEQIHDVLQHEQALLHHRAERYAPYRPSLSLRNRTVIVTDDGVATGATLMAALEDVRSQHPCEIIIAIPVMAAAMQLRPPADRYPLVVLHRPDHMLAIGYAYEDFSQVSDTEVCQALQQANAFAKQSAAVPAAVADAYDQTIANNRALANHRSTPPAAPH
ncbi:MAG: phosphoribosyltransferase family protein [Cyanobacteria bacterium J06635_1]